METKVENKPRKTYLKKSNDREIVCPSILKRSLLIEANNNKISSFNVNNERIHQCARCSYVSKNASNLLRHVDSTHIDFKCRYCEIVINGKLNLIKHIKVVHRIKMRLKDYFSGKEPIKVKKISKKTPKKRKIIEVVPPPEPIVQEPIDFLKVKEEFVLAKKMNAAIEKCFTKTFSCIRQRVQVLPVHTRISHWEMHQTYA